MLRTWSAVGDKDGEESTSVWSWCGPTACWCWWWQNCISRWQCDSVTVSMDNTEEEDCSAVDVSQRIKQFQSRINKITKKDNSRNGNNNNNNNSEYFENRNIVKTRSKSLPGKSPLVRYEGEELRSMEETPASAPAAPAPPAVGSSSHPEQQEEIVSLPSVKMLASKFSHQSRTRRIDSKVCF